MTKVHGKRYAYKFDFNGLMAACQQQAQGGDPTVNMLSAANYTHPSISRDLSGLTQVGPLAMYSTVPLTPNLSQTSIVTSSPNTSQSTVITTQAQSTSASVIMPSASNPTETAHHPSPHIPTSYW